MAAVPLVVVRTTVRPSTRARVNSSGELPRSKPGIGCPPRSPASTTPAPSRSASAAASSGTGTTRRQPASQAATAALVPQGPDLEPERVEIDEALRVALPVDLVRLEGDEVGPVEGPGRLPPRDSG